jgi:hypothetical protein
LGIIISASGKFGEARKILYNKALKGSFKLMKDLSGLNPSIPTIDLFDHYTITPIALYGSEIWGILNMSEKQTKIEIYIYKDWECEKLNIKFCKYILGVNKKTTNLAVLAELGKFPIYISIVTSIFMY